jgi:hypothetical protein
MNERRLASAHDRQMLAGAYWPVIAFAVVLVAERILCKPQDQTKASLR